MRSLDRVVPITGEMRLTKGQLALDRDLNISTLLPGQEARLDGVVDRREVIFVPAEKADASWMTGLNWRFLANPDGTWTILNQGQEDYALCAARDRVVLGRAGLASARWLIYRDSRHNHFMLRPVGLPWLSAGEDGPMLGRTDTGRPMANRWRIQPAT